MSVQIVRFDTTSERIAEVEQAIEELFTAVRTVGPSGMEYAAARIGDTAEFLLILTLHGDASNPLLVIPEARSFRERVAQWASGPAAPRSLSWIARYSG